MDASSCSVFRRRSFSASCCADGSNLTVDCESETRTFVRNSRYWADARKTHSLALYQASRALGLLSRSRETRPTTSESDRTIPPRPDTISLNFTSEFSAQTQMCETWSYVLRSHAQIKVWCNHCQLVTERGWIDELESATDTAADLKICKLTIQVFAFLELCHP